MLLAPLYYCLLLNLHILYAFFMYVLYLKQTCGLSNDLISSLKFDWNLHCI